MNERPTPETDSQIKTFTSVSKLKKSFENRTGTVSAGFARKLERERDDYKWQLHIAKGEIAEARKMERAWKKEETK